MVALPKDALSASQEADRMLKLWRARLLLPDYVALHHIAWSKYPIRPGWADFQRELQGLAGLSREHCCVHLGRPNYTSAPVVQLRQRIEITAAWPLLAIERGASRAGD